MTSEGARRLARAPEGVEVWWLPIEEPGQPRPQSEWDLLSPQEKARVSELQIPEVRETYTAARALLRRVLARYLEGDPGEWRFDTGPYGKPRLAGPGRPPLSFNLAHTRGLIGCAVTAAGEVGLDVENTSRRAPLGVADRFFSAQEALALRELDPAHQPQRFFELWTLKEAYLKACGLGLTAPLSGFTIDPEPTGRARIRFGPQIADDPSAWQLVTLRPGRHHLGALAVRGGPAGSILARSWTEA